MTDLNYPPIEFTLHRSLQTNEFQVVAQVTFATIEVIDKRTLVTLSSWEAACLLNRAKESTRQDLIKRIGEWFQQQAADS